MLLHFVPKIYIPPAGRPDVKLVDLCVSELGLVLRDQEDLVTRQPYPNKSYWVGCRKVGRKAISGLFIQTNRILPVYTVVSRWAVNAGVLLTHCVEHVVQDSEFDAISDDMTMWYSTDESLGGWSYRWPEIYSALSPLEAQPRMDLIGKDFGGSIRHLQMDEVVTEKGIVLRRKERFEVPTIERGRLFGQLARWGRLPEAEHAFSVE